jgi:hypothetical protein
MNVLPFEKQTDAVGHNVTGITFDRPIPYLAFVGNDPLGTGEVEALADRLGAVLNGEAEEQEEHYQEKCHEAWEAIDKATAALDPLTDPDGSFALAVAAGQQAYDALQRLQARFVAASQTVSDAKPGVVGAHRAQSLALALLFADESISLIISGLAAAGGARDHAQRGSHVLTSTVRDLQGAK